MHWRGLRLRSSELLNAVACAAIAGALIAGDRLPQFRALAYEVDAAAQEPRSADPPGQATDDTGGSRSPAVALDAATPEKADKGLQAAAPDRVSSSTAADDGGAAPVVVRTAGADDQQAESQTAQPAAQAALGAEQDKARLATGGEGSTSAGSSVEPVAEGSGGSNAAVAQPGDDAPAAKRTNAIVLPIVRQRPKPVSLGSGHAAKKAVPKRGHRAGHGKHAEKSAEAAPSTLGAPPKHLKCAPHLHYDATALKCVKRGAQAATATAKQ